MSSIFEDLKNRYGDDVFDKEPDDPVNILSGMIGRGSCRSFSDQEVDPHLVKLLCAAALASPTKSDLQQRDIVIISAPEVKIKLVELVDAESWISCASNIVVFCGNNRRQRKLHELRGHPFANDHLDAFFNASIDAGIALSAFVTAAEALGLGCCPISAVRNEAAAVSNLLALPDYVFPVAGLAFGYPSETKPTISMRLPLSATVHTDKYSETDIAAVIETYDQRRELQQPYSDQRSDDVFGTTERYGWSEDKSRQYALQERQSFGDFVRSKGFNLS